MRSAARWAKKEGATAIMLNTQVGNDTAIRLYESEGYDTSRRTARGLNQQVESGAEGRAGSGSLAIVAVAATASTPAGSAAHQCRKVSPSRPRGRRQLSKPHECQHGGCNAQGEGGPLHLRLHLRRLYRRGRSG